MNGVCFVSKCMLFNIRFDGHTWSVHDACSDLIVAEAASVALHPATVFEGEWRVRNLDSGIMEDSALKFQHASIESSPKSPLTMYDLGIDFFTRRVGTKIVYYIDPVSKKVYHSGAKCKGSARAGKRFCPLCMRSFSANNFITQHMRVKHPESARPGAFTLEAIFIDEL